MKGTQIKGTQIKLYYHKTDGGAEYLMDAFLECENGHREGIFEGAKYIVRIDGDIREDAELTVLTVREAATAYKKRSSNRR